MKKFFMFSLVAVVFAACCSQKTAKQSFDLYGKMLTLTELNGKAVTLNAERPATILFTKDDGRVSGNLGCNRFTGSFEIKGKSLKFSQLAATKMMCFDGMEIENGFNAALNSTDAFEVKDGALLLKKGSEVLAILK